MNKNKSKKHINKSSNKQSKRAKIKHGGMNNQEKEWEQKTIEELRSEKTLFNTIVQTDLTLELCKVGVELSPTNFLHIPNEILKNDIHKDIIRILIDNYPKNALDFINGHVSPMFRLNKNIKDNISYLTEFKIKEYYFNIIKSDGLLLPLLIDNPPNDLVGDNHEIYQYENMLSILAVSQNGDSLQYVNERYINYDLSLLALNSSGTALLHFNPNYINEYTSKKALLTSIKLFETDLGYVPEQQVWKQKPSNKKNILRIFEIIPNKTEELCELAFKYNENCIQHFPIDLITNVRMLDAVRRNYTLITTLYSIQNDLVSPEIVTAAVNTDWRTLVTLVDNNMQHLITYDDCMNGLSQDELALGFCPQELIHIYNADRQKSTKKTLDDKGIPDDLFSKFL